MLGLHTLTPQSEGMYPASGPRLRALAAWSMVSSSDRSSPSPFPILLSKTLGCHLEAFWQPRIPPARTLHEPSQSRRASEDPGLEIQQWPPDPTHHSVPIVTSTYPLARFARHCAHQRHHICALDDVSNIRVRLELPIGRFTRP